jgi:hypothetical protein
VNYELRLALAPLLLGNQSIVFDVVVGALCQGIMHPSCVDRLEACDFPTSCVYCSNTAVIGLYGLGAAVEWFRSTNRNFVLLRLELFGLPLPSFFGLTKTCV